MKIYINHESSSPVVDPVRINFGWVCEDLTMRGKQKGWRIEILQEEPLKRSFWSRAVENSSRSFGILCDGPQLPAASQFLLRLTVEDCYGHSETGERRFFTSFSADELKGLWIGSDRTNPGWLSERRTLPARYLRKKIVLAESPRFAPFAVSGLGLYELFVNGKKVSPDKLKPGLSHYDKRVYYNMYDLAPFLHAGENELLVLLGNGRYFSPRLRTPIRTKSYGLPSLFLFGRVHYPGGSFEEFASDGNWQVNVEGPLRENNEYDGELYDARRMIGSDQAPWEPAVEMPPPSGALFPQLFPPIRVTEELKPVSVRMRAPGSWLIDFGQNIAGSCRFALPDEISVEAGRKLQLRYGERLDDGGELYTENLRSVLARDIYITGGGKKEVWEPSFTIHGFRYVELVLHSREPRERFAANCASHTALNEVCIREGLRALVIHDDLEEIGHFSTSDELINRIYRNIRWGLRGNYRSIPTDCPQRDERQGWLGDRSIGSKGEAYLFDIYPLYRKWLTDMVDARLENGLFPSVAPPYWNIAPSELTWSGTFILIARMLADLYGDEAIIDESYPLAVHYLDYHFRHLDSKGLSRQDDYGDWCMPPESEKLIHSKDPARVTPPELLATTWLYHLTGIVRQWADFLGKVDDAALFRRCAGELKSAFTSLLYDPDRGCFGNGSVTSQILPLALGLYEPEQAAAASAWLERELRETHQSHVASGLVGMQWFYRLLSEQGLDDLALETLLNRDYPGLGYMIEKGATTIWELWNGDTADPAMNSGNHVMLVGDLIIWFYEYLAGIRAGFLPGLHQSSELQCRPRLLLKPAIPKKLSRVEASLLTRSGRVESSWEKQDGELVWCFSIPFNIEAEVHIPGSGGFLIESQDSNEGIPPFTDSTGERSVILPDGRWIVRIAWEDKDE